MSAECLSSKTLFFISSIAARKGLKVQHDTLHNDEQANKESNLFVIVVIF
jgi:hypothetical protein